MPPRPTPTLGPADCLTLLATRTLGRLVFTHRALPDVLPVSYVLDGVDILLRLAVGSPAAAATPDTIVAFETDDLDAVAGTGWSVTVVGRAREIARPDERLRAVTRDLRWWGDGGRTRLLAVAAEKITGQRLTTWPQTPDQGVQSAAESSRRAGGAAA
jgi:nitroimidazol reductase NimA-like FMN-containing flavoprotein (pyridoxamine 5'-phosphate oxidase superfamily)